MVVGFSVKRYLIGSDIKTRWCFWQVSGLWCEDRGKGAVVVLLCAVVGFKRLSSKETSSFESFRLSNKP